MFHDAVQAMERTVFAPDNDADASKFMGTAQLAASAPSSKGLASASITNDPYHGVYGNCVDFISSKCADDEEIQVAQAEISNFNR